MRLSLLLLMVIATPLSAQRISLGAGYAISDYREQADFLHFTGNGPSASLAVERGRLALRAQGWHLSFDPAGDAAAGVESFSANEVDIRLAVRLVSLLEVEGGYLRRWVSPSRAAQTFGAVTFGVRASYPLAPGAEIALRTAYVAGMEFSGGGSAPFGIGLGLSAAYGPASRRYWVTGDYTFERIDRRTDQNGSRLSVPIQSSVARLGVAVGF